MFSYRPAIKKSNYKRRRKMRQWLPMMFLCLFAGTYWKNTHTCSICKNAFFISCPNFDIEKFGCHRFYCIFFIVYFCAKPDRSCNVNMYSFIDSISIFCWTSHQLLLHFLNRNWANSLFFYECRDFLSLWVQTTGDTRPLVIVYIFL